MIGVIYKSIIRRIFFLFDAERVHHFTIFFLRFLSKTPFSALIERALFFQDPLLTTEIAGIKLANPIGLAAGLDKDAEAIQAFSTMGFGFIEVGTVTPKPQLGNDKPRIFRIPKYRALINRMGFPSAGAEILKKNLSSKVVNSKIGINIGKNKLTEIDNAVEDYVSCAETLKDLGDYFAINVSSPNTPDLRKLQEPERLKEILKRVKEALPAEKPLFVKLSPDLNLSELKEIVDVILSSKISGIIATNTTLDRQRVPEYSELQGGLSGEPIKEKSLKFITEIYKLTKGQIPIIGVGGISSADDAMQMFLAGANAIQIYTALIYEGPSLIRKIKINLANEIKKMGISSIAELVGGADKPLIRR